MSSCLDSIVLTSKCVLLPCLQSDSTAFWTPVKRRKVMWLLLDLQSAGYCWRHGPTRSLWNRTCSWTLGKQDHIHIRVHSWAEFRELRSVNLLRRCFILVSIWRDWEWKWNCVTGMLQGPQLGPKLARPRLTAWTGIFPTMSVYDNWLWIGIRASLWWDHKTASGYDVSGPPSKAQVDISLKKYRKQITSGYMVEALASVPVIRTWASMASLRSSDRADGRTVIKQG